MARKMPIVDEFVVDTDGSVTAWACAVNDLGIAHVRLRDCAAPRQECPRGFSEAFACRTVDTTTDTP